MLCGANKNQIRELRLLILLIQLVLHIQKSLLQVILDGRRSRTAPALPVISLFFFSAAAGHVSWYITSLKFYFVRNTM